MAMALGTPIPRHSALAGVQGSMLQVNKLVNHPLGCIHSQSMIDYRKTNYAALAKAPQVANGVEKLDCHTEGREKAGGLDLRS